MKNGGWIMTIEEGFDFNFGSFEFGVGPIDIWLEFLTPWVAKDKMILSQVGNVERYSFFFVSFADHEVTYVGDHSTFVRCSVDVMDWSWDG